MALRDGLTIDSPLDAFVGLLLELHSHSSSQACNTYSALLLIPGFADVKFHPLLKHVRKSWNKHTPKYAAFWDPVPVFIAFVNTQYDMSIIQQARIKLFLLWRFLGLFRSIDLARTVRSIASIGERHFIVVKRKNKHDYRFEEVLSLKLQVWSPFHVLCQYVALTSKLVPPGGPLLVTLHRPWSGLTSNSIANLTRSELAKFGVDMSIFGPHSTRGAFVELFRHLNLPSEVVACLGQWDSLEAFAKHYLRVGASGEAKQALDAFFENMETNEVHNSSLGQGCSSEVPHTHQEPVLQVTRGGSGTERERQSTSEPTQPSPRNRKRRRSLLATSIPSKLQRVEHTSSRGRKVTRFVVHEHEHEHDTSDGSIYDESASSSNTEDLRPPTTVNQE